MRKFIVKLEHTTYSMVVASDADHAAVRAVAIAKAGRPNAEVRAVKVEPVEETEER